MTFKLNFVTICKSIRYEDIGNNILLYYRHIVSGHIMKCPIEILLIQKGC